ncbi:MAG: hypothetical protein K2V71_10505 [Methylotenera sp.]|nr:hypothetical protein [Methylotenera sp.]
MSKLKNELQKIDSQFHGSSHITKPGDNIYLDLGFPPEEAAKLYDESQLKIAAKLATKQSKKSNPSSK